MRGAPCANPSPAIDGDLAAACLTASALIPPRPSMLTSSRSCAGFEPARHVAVAEKANRINPDGAGSWRGMVRGYEMTSTVVN